MVWRNGQWQIWRWDIVAGTAWRHRRGAHHRKRKAKVIENTSIWHPKWPGLNMAHLASGTKSPAYRQPARRSGSGSGSDLRAMAASA